MISLKTTLALIALAFSSVVYADHEPSVIDTQYNRIYVPDGFDNNDNVQIVGEGFFPTSCYRSADTKVEVNHTAKTISIKPTAYKYDGICLQVILQYDRIIDVGLLQEGTYTVMQETDGTNLGQIKVRAATTSAPDDYLYAPISQAFFRSVNKTNKVYLTGDFPVSCMKMKEVRSIVQPDVLIIQPIVEIDHSQPCKEGKFHFESATDVGTMKKGRYLLHVRSMNGKSVNSLVDVP